MDARARQICDDFTEMMLVFARAGAACEVHRDRRRFRSDVVIRIVPRRAGAATIDARLELDFGVYLLLGAATHIDVPFARKGHFTRGSWQQEVSALCEAVVSGEFREEVTYAGNRAVHARYTLALPGGATAEQTWGLRARAPWRKPRIEQHAYEAYEGPLPEVEAGTV